MLGSHFQELSTLIPQILLAAVTFLIILESARFDAFLRTRFTSYPQFGPSALIVISVAVIYYFSFQLILGFSLLGFLVSAYLRGKKVKNEPPYCFLRLNCSEVIYSRYSKTFGLANELVGTLYFLGIFLVTLLGFSQIPFIKQGLTLSSAAAAIFSLYLIFIQAVILKKWCEWCLISALCSISIFFLIVLL
jgi:uncharacterized membrane protein